MTKVHLTENNLLTVFIICIKNIIHTFTRFSEQVYPAILGVSSSEFCKANQWREKHQNMKWSKATISMCRRKQCEGGRPDSSVYIVDSRSNSFTWLLFWADMYLYITSTESIGIPSWFKHTKNFYLPVP